MSEMEIVAKEETFDKLEIRLGRVISIEEEPLMKKKSYCMRVDFGRFGVRTSVGRFTCHQIEEMKYKLVMGFLNFSPRQIGNTVSDVLILGVQFPKAESGEATFITPAVQAKLGSKLF
jgi:tRNA-binding protein